MSKAEFANALVQNLSIFDGTGLERKGSYAEKFKSVLAKDGNLTSLVCEYNVEIRGVVDREVWIRPEPDMKADHPYMRATRLVQLTDDWIDNVNTREATEAKLIALPIAGQTLRKGTAKFANALVHNLSIFDGTGLDRKDYYSGRFLSALAEDGDLTEPVCEYNVELRGIILKERLIHPEPVMKAVHPYMRANRLVRLTDDWIDGINLEATEAKLIDFLK